MTALGLGGKIGPGRASLTAPRRHAIALSVATGLLAIVWSLVCLGRPGFSKDRVFNLHPPLMISATFLLLPLSMRLVTTAGPPAHVALNAAAAVAAVAGVACAAVDHALRSAPSMYSAHSWVGATALALMAAAAVLGASGRHEPHRRVARAAVAALFAAAALGFAAAQSALLAPALQNRPTHPFAAGALAAAALALASLVVAAAVLTGDHGLLRRAVSVRTDVTVPISDGGSSSENDVVLYELDEAAGMGSAGMGPPGRRGAAAGAARGGLKGGALGSAQRAGPAKPPPVQTASSSPPSPPPSPLASPLASPRAKGGSSAEVAAAAALRVLGLLPRVCGGGAGEAGRDGGIGRGEAERASAVGEAAV